MALYLGGEIIIDGIGKVQPFEMPKLVLHHAHCTLPETMLQNKSESERRVREKIRMSGEEMEKGIHECLRSIILVRKDGSAIHKHKGALVKFVHEVNGFEEVGNASLHSI